MNQATRSDLGTFVGHVQHYENATWQGEGVWADQNRTQKFRSALELMKLMDSALETKLRDTGPGEDGTG